LTIEGLAIVPLKLRWVRQTTFRPPIHSVTVALQMTVSQLVRLGCDPRWAQLVTSLRFEFIVLRSWSSSSDGRASLAVDFQSVLMVVLAHTRLFELLLYDLLTKIFIVK
jgi:hypothetical protein